MTRRITAHKGGRTARINARIRPATLASIKAAMREQGKSFADLLEEQYSQGDDTMPYLTSRAQSEGEWNYLGKTIYGWSGKLWTGSWKHKSGQSVIELTPLSEEDKNALRKMGVLKKYL